MEVLKNISGFTVVVYSIVPHFPDDVAVVDEVQMIQDAERGAAWTRAVLGQTMSSRYIQWPV